MPKPRLVLGTAQLGMHYGLSNRTGQPPIEESYTILDRAFAAGINTFDTAREYGNAEEVLGEWIASRNLSEHIFVISKFKPQLDEHSGGSNVTNVIQKELKKSLTRLRLRCVDGYLLHAPEDLYREGVLEGLRAMKEQGLAKNVGVSIYDEEDALRAVGLGVDYIQVPCNVLDQRFDKTDFFQKAKEKGITVFARSPFLQGLLLMDPEHLPPHLSHARKPLEQFIAIAQKHGISQFEASLLFAYLHCRAEHIVFGVETLPQLEEILAVISRVPAITAAPWISEIVEAFQHTDRAIVNPSLWNRKK